MKLPVLTLALATSLSACSGKTAEEPFEPAEAQPEVVTTVQGVEDLLGGWRYSHQECEEDADPQITPDTKDIYAWLSVQADGTYEFTVEGFPFFGAYKVTPQNDGKTRMILDNNLHFVPEGDTLQNWGEGEATYVCGNVFVRGGP